MTKTIRRGRARLVPRVSAEVAQRLSDVCASTNATETAVVEAALRQHLDGTSDRTLLFRRLDRLGRALDRSHREIELLSEAFGVFVHVWFAHTPPLDEEEKKSARRDAESRHKQFLEHVTRRFSGGRRFLDDLPRESIADDAELIALAREGGGSPNG
jgi:predicted transcriptional regulator